MSVFLGIDIGTSGTKTLAIDEKGAILASAVGDLPLLLSQAAVERAGPRRLVASDNPLGPQGDGQGEHQAGGGAIHRSLGPDARVGVSRQRR